MIFEESNKVELKREYSNLEKVLFRAEFRKLKMPFRVKSQDYYLLFREFVLL